MRYEISEKAQQDLCNIESYLLEEWTIDVLEDFFQKYEDTHFHKFIITKHNSIIYSYGEDVLYIHRVLQNFQDPGENYKSLEK